MAKTNVTIKYPKEYNHGGAPAPRTNAEQELRRTVLTCLLFEDTFYETGNSIANRIAQLVPQVKPATVADLAIQARNDMKLRHAPLFMVRELARVKGNGPAVERALTNIIKRADEPAEFLAMYGGTGRRKHPISNGVKRALASILPRFSAYELAKYNRPGAVKLRDVFRIIHPKPESTEQAAIWKSVLNGTLQSPDTWEVALSGGADKKETFERLLTERKLGGLATLRNLRKMLEVGVDPSLVRERLKGRGFDGVLPFQFMTAARYAPTFEPQLEEAMLGAVAGMEKLPGKTGLLIDVSGSMDAVLSGKGEATRVDAAAGLGVLCREVCENAQVATFSNHVVQVPARRGFALRDAIAQSQPHGGTNLAGALSVAEQGKVFPEAIDRLIVITDEQAHQAIPRAYLNKAYIINVAPYARGVQDDGGWTRINGWSERIIDYIRALEQDKGE